MGFWSNLFEKKEEEQKENIDASETEEATSVPSEDVDSELYAEPAPEVAVAEDDQAENQADISSPVEEEKEVVAEPVDETKSEIL